MSRATGDEQDAGDNVIREDTKQAKHTANESENASGDSGQEGPDASKDNASKTNYSERLECTGERRGRLRDLDNHYSWRDVYRACDVRVGMNE